MHVGKLPPTVDNTGNGWSPQQTAAISAQLDKVLASKVFFSADRLRRFLRFVVESALRDPGIRIKEYVIGAEVFDRGPSYDPSSDPIVRIQAGRLRAKLAEYYRTEGQSDALIIEMPKGTYRPVFQPRNGTGSGESSASTETLPVPAGQAPTVATDPYRRARWLAALVGAGLTLLAIAALTGC